MDKAIAEVLENHRDHITRRHEWLAAKALTGTIQYVADDWEWTLSFNLPAEHTPVLSGTNRWSDTANSNPLRDIRTWMALIVKKTQITPDLLILGENAYGAFLDHPKVQDFFHRLRIEPGQLRPQAPTPEGVIPIGEVLGLETVAYIGQYMDDAGNISNYVDPNVAILVATRAPFKLHYAAVHDADEGVTAAVEIFTKSWTEKDPSIRWILSASTMVPVPHWPEAIVYATVL
jgi:hypothetical protein